LKVAVTGMYFLSCKWVITFFKAETGILLFNVLYSECWGHMDASALCFVYHVLEVFAVLPQCWEYSGPTLLSVSAL
jgi:hypothetical protein